MDDAGVDKLVGLLRDDPEALRLILECARLLAMRQRGSRKKKRRDT